MEPDPVGLRSAVLLVAKQSKVLCLCIIERDATGACATKAIMAKLSSDAFADQVDDFSGVFFS